MPRGDIPVIFITGYRDELLDRAPTAIAIQKPVNKDELGAAVRRALRRGNREQGH